MTSCLVYAARLRRLEQDLRHLGSALAGPPPPQLARNPARSVRQRWTTAAATLATMVMLAWFGVWWQQPSPPPQVDAHQESIWPLIDGVFDALFPSVEIGFTETSDRPSDLDNLQAALAGEWPCEGLDAFTNVDCDEDNTLALLLGEP